MKYHWIFRRFMDEETGAELPASSGGGGESAEPTTMLDAISEGLTVKDDGFHRDDAGRFAKKEGEEGDRGDGKNLNNEGDPLTSSAKPTPADVKKPDGEQKPTDAAAAKPEDEFAMPEGLSQKAQERFKSLVAKAQESRAVAEQANSDLQGVRQMITETGASPEEFVSALDYLRLIKNGDFEGALRVVDDQRRQISLAMGKALPGADPLTEFPDLRQAVESYQMTEQTAIEMARMRSAQQHIAQTQQQQATLQQRQSDYANMRNQAVTTIDRMGATWAKTDPDFAAKEDIILKQLPTIAAQFPPNMWPQQVKILYETLSAMPAPTQRTSNPPPLRPSGQSAGARQPANMLEALQSGLGYANG